MPSMPERIDVAPSQPASPPPLPARKFPERFDEGAPQSFTPDPKFLAWAKERAEAFRASDGILEDPSYFRGIQFRRDIDRIRGLGPQELPPFAADTSATPLAAWKLIGSAMPVNTVSDRMFERPDGMFVHLSEFEINERWLNLRRRDGLEGTSNRRVGRYPATLTTFRDPTGCVTSALSWHDEQVSFNLQAAGTLDLEGQRTLLMQLGESLARP
jgi:hypothetical protein